MAAEDLRNLPNPSGADVVAYVNLAIRKALSELQAGGGGPSMVGWKATDYDIAIHEANQHPGVGWEFVQAFSLGSAMKVYIMWRIPRGLQASQNQEPNMKVVGGQKLGV